MVGRDAAMHGGGGHGPGPAMPGTKPGTDNQVADGHDHPGAKLYIQVAIILAIVTLIEVAIYYIEGLRDWLVPILIVLSVGKFIAVVGWFMHLKFDDARFRWIFIAGMVITMSVVIALVAMFWTDNYYAPFPNSPAGAEPPGAE